jgi:transcriptional regulator with XRE-family HTH domain
MLRERRRGRPPLPLGVAPCSVTARLRRLVDDVHDGNLLEASAHAGVPYATLREIHAGRTRSPGMHTLERIARAYGLPLDWFAEGSSADDGTVPLAGWVGYLPADSADSRDGRRVTIPFSAWPLIRVLVFLENRLRDLPAEPSRPIIGAATDPRDIRRRLTSFILQPLLAARSVAGTSFDGGFIGYGESKGAARDQWVGMLRDLGRFWERALVGVFPEIAGGGAVRPAAPGAS